ncbi:LysR family transcriptional regulator [Tranquillimonas alkanivorans]|uniref:DNA-binding transcriptional regulator, LysR family n=1 Tax=Tranquillimonas alkanivorans TaxID=441119 RepID=A0A1I5Q6M5_9RHOB|nr:LysR family transcriptional regulator [Tranquillimonas alkanivorans]SFP41631.1 DNA-binding transcriptional regulator, LysR family [Tranquillimonas alkanivorans]
MDLRQLKTLIAVADTRSFAASAEIVNLTPSAVSQQIQALEAELGVVLFDRTRRPPLLNAKGEEVVRAARQVVQIMTEARQTVSGGSTGGVLKIGSIRTLSRRLVPAAFAAVRHVHPDLSFHLTVGMSEAILSDVAAGRLDAAVVAEHVELPAGLSWHLLLAEPLLLIAPKEWESEPPETLLTRLPFIRYETKVPLARQIDVELARLGIEPREVAVVNTMPSVIGCVLAGLGASVVPKSAIPEEASYAIITRPFANGPIIRRIGLVQRQVSSRSVVLSEVRRALADQAHSMGLDVPAAAQL